MISLKKKMNNYNVVLINLDGLRHDRIDLCPILQRLKTESYFFQNMHTVAPYTFASLHAIFSGMYPSKNGVNGYYNIFKFKKNEVKTLTQYLQQKDYYTSCDVIDESVIPRQGFDEYNIFDEKTVDFQKRHEDIIELLIKKKKKFFLFLHYTETHKHLVREIVKKYDPKSNDDNYFNSREENEERFNSYLPSCNEYVNKIFNILEKNNIANKTIVIIFSDHGTSLGEKKGEKFYGVFTYDYTIKVFCFVKIPNESPRIIETQCNTIDILPTILDLVGMDSKKLDNIQGKSLLEFITNKNNKDREVFVETGGLYGPWPSPTKPNVFCIKINNKKLIYNETPKKWEFYDLSKDPNEINNIYNETSDEIKFFKMRLAHYLNENEINVELNS